MENPYWHPEVKPHSVDTESVRALLFEIYNLITTSASLPGQGGGHKEEEDGIEIEPGEPIQPIEALHYQLAERELSRKLLQTAMMLRTLDDIYANAEGNEGYVAAMKVIDTRDTVGCFSSSKTKDLRFREACNKIIHAQDIRPVYDSDDDRHWAHAKWGMDGTLELEGTQRGMEWEVVIYMPPFLNAAVDILNAIDEIRTRSA